MSKRKFFAPLMGAVVLGLSAYAGYRTYDAFNGVSESDLLLANAEALASDSESGVDVKSCLGITAPCKLSDGSESLGPLVSVSW